MELTYTKCGDYFIPDLVLSDTKEYHIGKYGRMHRAYLKEYRPILYTDLIVTEKLFSHLEEIGTACRERLEISEKAHAAGKRTGSVGFLCIWLFHQVIRSFRKQPVKVSLVGSVLHNSEYSKYFI